MTRPVPASVADRANQPIAMERIVVGVAGDSQAWDAALLAETIARATGAEVMLVAVQVPVPAGPPHELGEADTEARLADAKARLHVLQARMAPEASVAVERARSVASGLARVVIRERGDSVVVGSSRHAPEGRVRIGRRTRQLLVDAHCPIAVAPRGLSSRGPQRLGVIGAGYDGTPESSEALKRAESLARAAGAQLRVRAVVDDRLPYVGWTPTSGPDLYEMWDAVIEPSVEALRENAERAVSTGGVDAVVEAEPGLPHEQLIALSREVDLLVIGSGRWGAAARALGTTGEELMHQSRCSVMVVPRPAGTATAGSGARPSTA